MDPLEMRKEKVYQVYRSFQPKADYIAVGFRVSSEQKADLFQLVKRDPEHATDVSQHMLKNTLAQRIVVIGSERFRIKIQERLSALDPILEKLEQTGRLSGSEQEELRMIREIRKGWEARDAV